MSEIRVLVEPYSRKHSAAAPMSFSRISCTRRFGRRSVVRLAVDALSAESSRAPPVSDSGDAFFSADPSTCEADAMTPLLALFLMMTLGTQTAPADDRDRGSRRPVRGRRTQAAPPRAD